MLTEVLVSGAAGLLVYAALHDLAARTVPNWLPVALLLLGLCARIIDHSLFSGLVVAGCTFAVLFVIWLLGAMGGGDVKLWAATVLLVPPLPQSELDFFLRVVVFGGVLAVVYLSLGLFVRKPRVARGGSLLHRLLRAEAWRISKRAPRAPLPYACAIAGGAITTLLPLSLQR